MNANARRVPFFEGAGQCQTQSIEGNINDSVSVLIALKMKYSLTVLPLQMVRITYCKERHLSFLSNTSPAEVESSDEQVRLSYLTNLNSD